MQLFTVPCLAWFWYDSAKQAEQTFCYVNKTKFKAGLYLNLDTCKCTKAALSESLG